MAKTEEKKWTPDKPVLVDREKFEKAIDRLLKGDPPLKNAVKASRKD